MESTRVLKTQKKIASCQVLKDFKIGFKVEKSIFSWGFRLAITSSAVFSVSFLNSFSLDVGFLNF